MAIVSISEVSRLTGKTRATIHRHINTGAVGIDTSELIRVYDINIDTPSGNSPIINLYF